MRGAAFAAPRRHPVRFPRFSDLARFRVHDILLVSSLYDSFILAEDGELQEVILKEFLDLNVRHTPGVTHVSTGGGGPGAGQDRGALQPGDRVDVRGRHVGRGPGAAGCGKPGIDTPVVALALRHARGRPGGSATGAASPIDRVFLWQGDVRLVPAIVKYVEDRRNVAHDTGVVRRPGDPRRRGQRPVLLVVPADHVRRADAPRAQPRARGREPVAQADAAAGAAEDPAVRLATRRRWRVFRSTTRTTSSA